jgi:hypothetical protein
MRKARLAAGLALQLGALATPADEYCRTLDDHQVACSHTSCCEWHGTADEAAHDVAQICEDQEIVHDRLACLDTPCCGWVACLDTSCGYTTGTCIGLPLADGSSSPSALVVRPSRRQMCTTSGCLSAIGTEECQLDDMPSASFRNVETQWNPEQSGIDVRFQLSDGKTGDPLPYLAATAFTARVGPTDRPRLICPPGNPRCEGTAHFSHLERTFGSTKYVTLLLDTSMSIEPTDLKSLVHDFITDLTVERGNTYVRLRAFSGSRQLLEFPICGCSFVLLRKYCLEPRGLGAGCRDA